MDLPNLDKKILSLENGKDLEVQKWLRIPEDTRPGQRLHVAMENHHV